MRSDAGHARPLVPSCCPICGRALRLEGHSGPRMSREDAAALVERLEAMHRE
ncbi:hypothetical protein [uncultured Desulfovibrio sp.]|uniref:hypothetical protein n=1 Tax=uncultured Desulfovibrio sp. TaxID=167968 RepID=UPI002620A1EC|nr:hypothetical protein [uncultured Desulfovibrio sp.]